MDSPRHNAEAASGVLLVDKSLLILNSSMELSHRSFPAWFFVSMVPHEVVKNNISRGQRAVSATLP